jgi:hypothetical protein
MPMSHLRPAMLAAAKNTPPASTALIAAFGASGCDDFGPYPMARSSTHRLMVSILSSAEITITGNDGLEAFNSASALHPCPSGTVEIKEHDV